MADTAPSYFKKIVLSTKIRLSNGNPIPWVNVGWNVGVLETTDPITISELTKRAKEERGGVTVIDKATFDELKKNSSNTSPRQVWRPTVSWEMTSPLGQASPNQPSEKPSKPDAAGKAKVKTDKPATAVGVVPGSKPLA